MTCRQGRLHGRLRGDTGASTVELVMYTPLLMLTIFVIVQFALSWYGNEVAGAAAREAARVARVGGGTPSAIADAEAAGAALATNVGGNGLTDVEVEVVALPLSQEVRATVTGRSVEIVAGLAPRVSASVQGPVEVFRPDE
ncbi:pilus assembly protein [Actinotalea sp. M2MS4P-6]|uniref:TadE/TadG family type IV pilus assembly protein n=1 Tax=Actinotalea sp. M2MS4P-6 TaxID=2983762 RepID=UPI0021E4B580|nr:TadE/TadG family type IV pilus assembly protein [Actinotalea sp. M2MS4P-6]MCV2394548.1 pilus assembly protein [Actinotalea sp. M2MS4P-6]